MPFVAEVAPAEEVVSAGAGSCELLGLTKLLEVSLAEEVMLAGVTTVVDVIVPPEDTVGSESGEANGAALGQPPWKMDGKASQTHSLAQELAHSLAQELAQE